MSHYHPKHHQIFFKSFHDAKKKALAAFGVTSALSVSTVLLWGKNFFNLDVTKSIIFGLILIILMFIVFFIALWLKNYFEDYNDWRLWASQHFFGEGIKDLNDAFGELNGVMRQETISDEMLVICINKMSDVLKRVFDRKENGEYSVSFKCLTANGDMSAQAIVKNIGRDKAHTVQRDINAYKEKQHIIYQNTCYNHILTELTTTRRNDKFYYLNNNIKETKHYTNSSIRTYCGDELPYNSELVVPIMPLISDTTTMLGFLCVDSSKSDSFNEAYDVHVLRGVSDRVYDLIQKWNISQQVTINQ